MFEIYADGQQMPRVAYLQVVIEALPRQILKALGAGHEQHLPIKP